MKAEIENAIRHKRVLSVWYSPGMRLIEPHALGYSQSGKLLLRAYQISGASDYNASFGWKLFEVQKMQSVAPTGASFTHPRSLFNPNDRAMKGGIVITVACP